MSMNKNTIVSALFVLLALVVAVGASYLVLSYATGVLNAIVVFVSTNDLNNLGKCGISVPPEFAKLKADIFTVIVPFLNIGMPAVLLVVGVLMFLAGFYYHKSRHEDEEQLKERMQREMVHKLVRKIEVEKKAPGSSPDDEFAEPESIEDAPSQEDAPADEPPPAPAQKAIPKKKK